jgi:DNA polymerase beta
MRLNEYGLWRSAANSKSSDEWTLVEGSDEEAILKEIGMEYVEPEKRNFSYVTGSRKYHLAKKKAVYI